MNDAICDARALATRVAAARPLAELATPVTTIFSEDLPSYRERNCCRTALPALVNRVTPEAKLRRPTAVYDFGAGGTTIGAFGVKVEVFDEAEAPTLFTALTRTE